SGHGGYDDNESTTKIEINKNESIAVEDLFTRCERQLFIFDCCRSIPRLLQESEDSYYFASTEADYSYLRNIYREKYNSYLRNSAKGIVQIFSCDIGETAQDWDKRGGLFSYNYIQSAKGDRDLSVKDVFDIADQKVIKASGNKQHPQICRPRSGATFPFYIA
ncbi:MAG: caspase family protein, partial [Treponema sp.]|nr:caspase family protein [Treponema sp.]